MFRRWVLGQIKGAPHINMYLHLEYDEHDQPWYNGAGNNYLLAITEKELHTNNLMELITAIEQYHC